MAADRIVSFLPSATDLLYELGVQDRLYGVTHECRRPAGAAPKPRVIDSVIRTDGLSSGEIDAATRGLLEGGGEIFALDEDVLRDADPDLIIAQGTCQVCAAHSGHADRAARILGAGRNGGGGDGVATRKGPAVHLMDPHSMWEIVDSVTRLGEILGVRERAEEIAGSLRARIGRVVEAGRRGRGDGGGGGPSVLAVEWLDPPFSAGHWIPEMIEMAGGRSAIGATGERSRPMGMREMVESDPDIVVVMPCGFGAARAASEYHRTLGRDGRWNSLRAVRDGRVFAVDAGSFFSKPGIRTVDGLEILAGIVGAGVPVGTSVPEGSCMRLERGSNDDDGSNGSAPAR